MKARALLGSLVLSPDELKNVSKAFDDAWEQVSPQISLSPEAMETARLKLAELVIGLAINGKRDAGTIRATAVQLMLSDRTELRIATDAGGSTEHGPPNCSRKPGATLAYRQR